MKAGTHLESASLVSSTAARLPQEETLGHDTMPRELAPRLVLLTNMFACQCHAVTGQLVDASCKRTLLCALTMSLNRVIFDST